MARYGPHAPRGVTLEVRKLGSYAPRDEAAAADALAAKGLGLAANTSGGHADDRYAAFMRLLPSALAARRDFAAMANALVVSLSATFDALAGMHSRRGPLEGQVFCCGGMNDQPFVAAVSSIRSAAVSAFERLAEEPLEEFESGLPFRLDDEGRRATFVWFDEGRAGAFVMTRAREPFTRATLATMANCTAVAAEVVALGADMTDLEMETRHDFLTGLLNRSFFEHALPAEIERSSRFGGHFSLVFMDLDGFKRFNDSFGHRRGDDFLRQVGRSLSETLRRADTAMRYGGDEFAVILPNTTPDQVTSTLGRLKEKIEAIARQLGADTIVSASFGLAHWPTDATTAEELVGKADSRLYHAKYEVQARAEGNGTNGGREQRNRLQTPKP